MTTTGRITGLMLVLLLTAAHAVAQSGPAIIFFEPGNSITEGTGPVDIGIGRTGNTQTAVTMSYQIANPGSIAIVQPTAGTISFAPGETRKTVPVQRVDDSLYHGTQNVLITLSNLSAGAQFNNGSATMTTGISRTDNDPKPQLQISDAVTTEGNSVRFVVTLSPPAQYSFQLRGRCSSAPPPSPTCSRAAAASSSAPTSPARRSSCRPCRTRSPRMTSLSTSPSAREATM